MNIESLGISKEDLLTLLVDRLEEKVDYESRESIIERVESRINKLVTKGMSEAVEKIGAEHVSPMVHKLIDDHAIKMTNAYGDEKEQPMSFTEYLVKRADDYMHEPVNYKGMSKGECRNYSSSFATSGTRLAFMIDKKIGDHIERGVSEALKDIKSELNIAITEQIKISTKTVIDRLKITVK